MPITVEIAATISATSSEVRVPAMTCASMSCPIRSVPNGWAADGPLANVLVIVE